MRLSGLALLVAVGFHVMTCPAIAQTFVFGAQGGPVQLDPAVITDGISSRITRQIFDGLVRYRGSTTEVEPALAEKWEVSRDGRVWTFELRHNVKFHDGTPRSEEHTSELQSQSNLVCRLLLEKKKKNKIATVRTKYIYNYIVTFSFSSIST